MAKKNLKTLKTLVWEAMDAMGTGGLTDPIDVAMRIDNAETGHQPLVTAIRDGEVHGDLIHICPHVESWMRASR